MTEAEIASIVREWPDTFAAWASEGRWVAYPWVQYLSKRVMEAIEKGGARILISAPPQHGKSQLISNWMPTWFLNKFPHKKVIFGTYAQAYADTWGSRVKTNLTTNKRCYVPLKQDSKSKRLFVTAQGGQMLSVGVDGPATGQGADLFIVDDPFKNYEDAMSERMREHVLDWYRSVATTRLQPGGSVVILHTRWHEEDLIGTLAQEGDWEYINLPAIAGENDPMGRKPGSALCPERYDEKALDLMRREVGEMIWSALYQGEPVQVGGNIIKGEWIKRYQTLPMMDEVAIFADLTYKDGQENDFASIEAWGRAGANIYLIAQIRAQMGFAEQLQSLERMFGLYPDAFHKEIEEAANGAAIIETLKATFPGIEAVKPRTEKAARLSAVAPLYHAGNVWYPDESIQPWVNVNLNEITKFPKAKNDDTVDTATMAVSYFGRMASSMRAMEALSNR